MLLLLIINRLNGVHILTCALIQILQYLHFTITRSHSKASRWNLEWLIAFVFWALSQQGYRTLSWLQNPIIGELIFTGKYTLYCYIIVYFQYSGSAMLKTEHCDFRVILGRGWSLTRNRKQKNMSSLWPYKSSVKSEKQNGYLQSGRVREVVASREVVTMRELTVN